MSSTSPRLGDLVKSIDQQSPVGPSRTRGLMTVIAACFSILTTYLPFSAVSAVLGTIGRGTGASTSDLQWTTDAYALALTCGLLLGGTTQAELIM